MSIDLFYNPTAVFAALVFVRWAVSCWRGDTQQEAIYWVGFLILAALWMGGAA
jgi:hypothetical protein